MTTIMEDFDYLWVTECISENFLTELKCLHIGVVEDTMDINQESVKPCIYLDHLDIPIFPQPTLQVNAQDLTRQDCAGAFQYRFHIEDIE